VAFAREEAIVEGNNKIVLNWRGKETIEAALSRLSSPGRVEIVLPVDYNHALFARLNPDAEPARQEDLNVEGDETLLREVSSLHGLEALAGLIEPLSRVSAKVTVVSPPRIVIVLD
jgi:hypothetical protein